MWIIFQYIKWVNQKNSWCFLRIKFWDLFTSVRHIYLSIISRHSCQSYLHTMSEATGTTNLLNSWCFLRIKFWDLFTSVGHIYLSIISRHSCQSYLHTMSEATGTTSLFSIPFISYFHRIKIYKILKKTSYLRFEYHGDKFQTY